MKEQNKISDDKMYEILNILVREQRELAKKVEELKKEQVILKDEIRIQNIVLSSFPVRAEILN